MERAERRGPHWPQLTPVPAICYSGYRDGQSPATRHYPSAAEVLEDLQLLLPLGFRHLRLYDATPHAALVLDTIRQHALPFTVMLGAYLEAEVSNPSCPWGGVYSEQVLAANARENDAQLVQAIALARRYPELVSSVSAGNEATVEWTDHLVPVERVLECVRVLQAGVRVPVTFCENYVPWTTVLAPLAAQVDFISVHTYPVWEAKPLAEALAYTEANYLSVADRYPGKTVVITEAGWPTRSNGRGIPPQHVDQLTQRRYLEQLQQWSASRGVLTFVFEAFDERWKGSPHPDEPEKHWGLFTADRRPKLAAQRPAP